MPAKGPARVQAVMCMLAICLYSLPWMSAAQKDVPNTVARRYFRDKVSGADKWAVLKATDKEAAAKMFPDWVKDRHEILKAGVEPLVAPFEGAGSFPELYNEIMRARTSRGLSSIPICSHLNTVAAAHVADLQANPPSSPCNMHSWSQATKWTGCCYTPDHAQASCMWNKPRELSGYRGNGFEVSHRKTGGATPQSAVEGWLGSKQHSDVMLNAGKWSQAWGAVGVAVSGDYAVAWFGRESC